MRIIMPDLIINQMEKNIAEDNIIKDMRNLFTSKRKYNFIYGKTLVIIIRDTRTLFEEGIIK